MQHTSVSLLVFSHHLAGDVNHPCAHMLGNVTLTSGFASPPPYFLCFIHPCHVLLLLLSLLLSMCGVFTYAPCATIMVRDLLFRISPVLRLFFSLSSVVVDVHQYHQMSGSSSTPPPPPLTPEEKAARDARLQREHESYIRGIATMRSLPRLRSTIAGAGGKTNTITRIAEEREEMRQRHLRSVAEKSAEMQRRRQEHQEKVERLESMQAKKRQRRLAKQQRKKMKLEKAKERALQRQSSSQNSSSEASDSDDDDSTSVSSSSSSTSSSSSSSSSTTHGAV
jgi:hypothetical protein